MRNIFFFLIIFVSFSFVSGTALASTSVDQNISSNTTWVLSGSPYIVSTDSVVEPGVSLDIDPGVVVQFQQGASLGVLGTLSAEGSALSHIHFESLSSEYWESIRVLPGGSASCVYCDISHAQFGFEVTQGGLTVSHVRIFESTNGISAHNADVTISDSVIENIESEAFSLFENSEGSVTGLEVSDVGSGVSVFNNSHLTATDLTIQTVSFGDAISVFNTSSISVTEGVFEDGEAAGVSVWGESTLTLSDVFVRSFAVGVADNGGSTIVLDHVAIHSNDIGMYVIDSELSSQESGIFGNATGFEHYGTEEVNLENIWWGSVSGPYHAQLNPNGPGNAVIGDVDFNPWLLQNPFPVSGPTIDGVTQYKRDGTFVIPPGGLNASDTMVLASQVYTTEGLVQMEIEFKPVDEAFDATGLVESLFVPGGSTAVVTMQHIENGEYHFRARAVDSTGVTSEWVEYNGPNGTDVRIAAAPLYTQIPSPYPDTAATTDWANDIYAAGNNGSCGTTIAGCGCALVSAVMLLRYYGITTVQGQDVNPKNLNQWLINNNGYFSGAISWPKVAEYAGNAVQFIGAAGANTHALLDLYLAQGRPSILNVKAIGSHFILATNKLTSTYEVRDPSYYNTKTLSDSPGPATRNYANSFSGQRLFIPNPNLTPTPYIQFILQSPAEIIVTDSTGKRVGKNPRTGKTYEEAEGSSYAIEMYDSQDTKTVSDHAWKTAYIPNPILGEYTVEVIGTGTGKYTLSAVAHDKNGEAVTSVKDRTSKGKSTKYRIMYASDGLTKISIVPAL